MNTKVHLTNLKDSKYAETELPKRDPESGQELLWFLLQSGPGQALCWAPNPEAPASRGHGLDDAFEIETQLRDSVLPSTKRPFESKGK